jgi:hypothetical protein
MDQFIGSLAGLDAKMLLIFVENGQRLDQVDKKSWSMLEK